MTWNKKKKMMMMSQVPRLTLVKHESLSNCIVWQC